MRCPEVSEINYFPAKSTLISYIRPAQNQDIVKQLSNRQLTVFAMDCIPRISRAQVISIFF